jgi:hypothetical protein
MVGCGPVLRYRAVDAVNHEVGLEQFLDQGSEAGGCKAYCPGRPQSFELIDRSGELTVPEDRLEQVLALLKPLQAASE